MASMTGAQLETVTRQAFGKLMCFSGILDPSRCLLLGFILHCFTLISAQDLKRKAVSNG